MYQSIMIRQ